MINRTLPLSLGTFLTAACLGGTVLAQSDMALETRTDRLQELSEKLRLRDLDDRRQVREFANRAGIPVRRELPNGRVILLRSLFEKPSISLPVFNR